MEVLVMRISERILLALNRRFKLPVHPFNLSNDGVKTYAEWQFDKGADTIKFYTGHSSAKDMFGGKRVLDVGCGAAGKSLYYASLGTAEVTGLEILEKYRKEAVTLAKKKRLDGIFRFVCADAANTGLKSASFDTIIMNDAMEHVADPSSVLRECARLLAPGGRIYLNFPPYNHPFGAHLSDAIAIPWVHLFFSRKTLISAYKLLVTNLPDGDERVSFRISADSSGNEYFSYINGMTIRRFKKIMNDFTLLDCIYYREVPLRGFLKPIAKLPLLREMFVKMVVAVIGKKPGKKES
jgi:SAM-dependent methyltransferase